jgi:LPXTG-motif cell wall-anchored protein
MSEGRGPREGAGPIAGGSFELTGQHDAYIIAAVLGLGLLLILVGLLLSSRKKVFLEGAGK